MKWVSFHTHTTHSHADGFGTVEQHVKRVADLGMSSLAVSEHGNVNSHAALERHCKEAGIKPIFGLEAYFGPVGEKQTRSKTHLTIFAQNQEGYHNLNKIVTESYQNTFNKWPTVSPSSLKRYNEGIVVLSGCADSLISCTLLGGKFLGERREPETLRTHGLSPSDRERVNRKLQWFIDVFGPDRFFLEVQRFPYYERTCALNPTFAQLAKDFGISLIATADVHYPHIADRRIQAILHASRWANTQPEFAQDASWELNAKLTYPESDKEIEDDLVATGLNRKDSKAAIQASANLAEKCTVELPKAKKLRFPGVKAGGFACGKGEPSEADRDTIAGFAAILTLKDFIKRGWKKRCEQRPDLQSRRAEYNKRIQHELKVIADKDFADYFLSVADLVAWCKQPAQDITVGPGRGSAAGSLICYVLGITEIDPLHPTFSRMIFERFIDPSRTDMPDIDLDFDDEKREHIVGRAQEIYGPENVCHVANHNKYRGKAALAGVAAAYGLPRNFFNEIGKRIPDRVETDERLADSIEDTITAYRNHPKISELLDSHWDKINEAMRLEDMEHSMGIHAGGFVISSQPIPETCPIYEKTKGTGRARVSVQVIPYEKRDAEYLNLLKMDFLGLTTMGMIGLCRKWTGMSLDELYSLFYSNSENVSYGENDRILQLFRDDDITGIFQYEGGTTRQVTRDVQPDNFDELAACNALSRPGPLYGGQTSEYIKVKNGERDWERIHPTGFDRHVEWTYGQIVYQEQIMWILRDLAGFSTERVLKVRKIIGKKLGEFQFKELWGEFRDGCASNGVSEDAASKVWSGITTAAGYAFNTSHAYSYALVAWWQAYFKIHHPLEFYAATLAKNGDGKNDIARRTKVLQDYIEHGYSIAPMTPNLMRGNWYVGTLDNKIDGHPCIIPGYKQIETIGEFTAKDIGDFIETRGGLTDDAAGWASLIQIKGIGLPTVEKMIMFCCKDDPLEIFKTSHQLGLFRKQLINGEFAEIGLPDIDQFVGTTASEFAGSSSSEEVSELTGGSDIPGEENWVAWVGLVSNIHEKDEIDTLRVKTGKSVEEIRAEMDEPDKSKKATLFAYDESAEVSINVSRWVYDNLSEAISNIVENDSIVVVWGRTFTGRPNRIQARNLWVFDPD
jgi:DNA polymerase-3 subunit alpha